MKKILFFASALAGLFFAASCQQEEFAPVEESNVVTFEVGIPEVATKAAVVDNGNNINDLVYAVYRTDATSLEAVQADKRLLTLLYQKNYDADETTFVTVNGKQSAYVPVELLNNGQNFVVVFWAQVEDKWVGEDFDLLNGIGYPVEMDANGYPVKMDANNSDFAAFTGISFLKSDNLAAKKSIELKRPFAQINVASTLPAQIKDVVLSTSTVKVMKAGKKFDVINQVASETETVEFNPTELPAGNLTVAGNTYKYIAMNYVFASGNVEVEYTINTAAHGIIKNTVSNVPVAANYRTNIVGNLLTSTADYTVTLAPFNENSNSGTVEVITEGIVKNQNGDYEVSNENGLAHAINNLMKNGGNFYLTAAEYDMTGIDVNPLTIEANKTLNIYGETPVVTRSATTSFAGITIKGLDNIINTIPASANVSISGVQLVDEGSVLVETNNGALVVSESTGEESIVGNGNEPVEADNVKDIASLKAAIASAVKTIEIAADIEATECVEIKRSVVINGNDKKFTSSATRAFRIVEESDIEVTFNNLKVVSTAVRVGTNDVRGVSIDPELSNVELTMNNCTIEFTDNTTNDWTYAVNVSGNGTGHIVTINGGSYEGANVVNVHSAKNVVTIKNATLNSLYPNNDVYYGACVWVLQKQGSSVYAEGNTFNGNNAIAFNLGTGTALEEKDNVDNTTLVVAKVGQTYFTSLAEAFAAAESGATVKVLQNTKMDAVTVANGKTITLELNNKTVTGVDTAAGSYGLITNKGNLTVHGPGAIKLSANTNRGWNAYSSVISNTVGGELVVDGGAVIEHLGGTDMAYGIDNLTNGKGTSAIATVDGATVKSVYRAIRQFLNGVEATNELYVKANSKIYGPDNKSIWMQDPSAKANTGKLVVEEGAELYGDVYLTVTAGSTEWPVSASIPASALKEGSQVLTTNVPAGYSVENVGGVWEVIAWTSVSTADELVAALEDKKSVIFANDIKIDPASMSNAYGATGINVKYGQAINGNGYTLNIKGAGGTWDSGINTTGGLIKDLTVTGSFRGIFINHTSTYSEKVVLENVTIGGNGTVYTISCDQGLYQGIEATNCTFNGWTSFAKTAGEAKFVNCSFGEGSGYKYCRPYSNTEFVNCTFCPGYAVDTTRATVTFTDCTWEE